MKNQFELGFIDVPNQYFDLDEQGRKDLCNRMIDTILHRLDKDLPRQINRIKFLDEILETSIISNNELEMYEVSQVLYEMRKILGFDKGD